MCIHACMSCCTTRLFSERLPFFYECTWHLIRWLTDVQLAQPLCSGCLYNCLCDEKKGETQWQNHQVCLRATDRFTASDNTNWWVELFSFRHGEQWRNIQPEQIDSCMSTALTRLTLQGQQLLWAFVEILKKNFSFLTSNLLRSCKFLKHQKGKI